MPAPVAVAVAVAVPPPSINPHHNVTSLTYGWLLLDEKCQAEKWGNNGKILNVKKEDTTLETTDENRTF